MKISLEVWKREKYNLDRILEKRMEKQKRKKKKRRNK